MRHGINAEDSLVGMNSQLTFIFIFDIIFDKYIMNINLPFVVSILAPILTFSQLIPQLYKTYKTKRVKDLSIHTIFIIFFI